MTGFLANPDVRIALLASAVVAALSAAIGYFVVLRSLSFAGHAVTDIGLTGGAGALLIGVDPLWGLVAFSVAAALAVGALGDRARERDIATGLTLAVALGIGALFLHLQTQFANAQSTLLFGSIFETDPRVLKTVVAIGVAAFVALAILYRPLLFASVSTAAARVAGVPLRALGFAFLALMAVSVAETAQIVGVLISTALLVGPPATAIALVRSPLTAIALAMMLGIAESWAAIALAYGSYDWSATHRGWPVSFFVTAFALGGLLLARVIRRYGAT